MTTKNETIKNALTNIMDMLPNLEQEAAGVVVLTVSKPDPETGNSMEAAQMYAHPMTAMNLLASGYINVLVNLAEDAGDLVPVFQKQLTDLLGFVEGHTSASLRQMILEQRKGVLVAGTLDEIKEQVKKDESIKNYS